MTQWQAPVKQLKLEHAPVVAPWWGGGPQKGQNKKRVRSKKVQGQGEGGRREGEERVGGREERGREGERGTERQRETERPSSLPAFP